jgi:hypothetical protein
VSVGETKFEPLGTVGFLIKDGADIQVAGATTEAAYVILLTHSATPTVEDRMWSVVDRQADGFSLGGSKANALSGFVVASSILPDCTGTLVPQSGGQPDKVDGTKPCKPWASYLPTEYIRIK